MNKQPNNSGWILCPSKSYPGKFYYFNIQNGEAAWCFNENEVFKKDVPIQKVKTIYLYPKPITPPHHLSPRAFNYHSRFTTCLPTFNQSIFPKYISNDKEIMGNIGTPIQMLQQVTNTKLMWNQNRQTEQDIMNVYTHTFPLSNQFENKINKNIGSINYVAATNPKDWWNSTNVWSNFGKHSGNTDMQYKRKISIKPILKESKLNKLQHRDIKTIYNKHVKQDSTQLHCNKGEIPKTMLDNMSVNLDSNDLRYVLRARQRKPVVMGDFYNKINREYSTFNDTNKVTNIRDNNTFNSKEKYIGGITTYKNNGNQQASEWYLVVDLDVLLEDYEFIKSYINKDENCHLYVPSVIQNQLKVISKEEYGGRSRVIVARKLLRYLGSVMRLNLPENKEDTRMYQIINCCLEIIKVNYDVVLITKEIELIQTAKLYKIKAYHINALKSNGLENNIHSNKHNLFLQNMDGFDSFGLSKTIRASDNNFKLNISGINKSIFNYNLNVNKNNLDISDMDIYFSKLNINDKTLNIKSKVKNKIVKSHGNINYNFKTLFHNISINKAVQRNSNGDIKNSLFNGRKNISITFNTYKENKDYYTNVGLTKPLNEVHEISTNIFENMLKKFPIKNSIMENNLYLRFDECVCSYEQIIEEFLYIVLQNYLQQVNQPPPWFLHEGMKCLKEIYKDNSYIINIIENLLYYYDFSSGYGSNIKPHNFMKLFGCSFYLVEALEKTSPLLIADIKKKLIYLRDMLELPIEDLVVDDCEWSGCYKNTEDKGTNNTVKNPSNVLDYLKKNFSEWNNYYEGYDNTIQIEQKQGCDDIKVLKSFGKDLNKVTINKSKCLYITKETDKQTHKHDFQSNDYPKVIRNVKLLDKFEEKVKGNTSECPETAKTISSISIDGNVNNAIINDIVSETNDFEIVSVNNDSKNNYFSINDINDSTKDNGFGTNSVLAYSLVRTFLSELSSSFKIIHTFIAETIKNYNEDMSEENKRNLYEKANKTYTHLAEIIDKLKIIIQRESNESSTLRSLLIKADSDVSRTSRYRPVVMKCLEQATILEKSLKLILSITNDEMLTVSSEENLHLIKIDE